MTKQAPQQRSIPISRLLLITVGLLIALSCGSVLLLLRATSEHLLLNVGTRALLRTMDVIETVVRSHLNPARIQVESLGRLMQSADFDLSNDRLIANTLQGAIGSTPQIKMLAYCDSDLQLTTLIWDANAETLTIENQDSSDDELVVSINTMMRNATGAQWGELIDSKEIDRTLLNVRFPIRRDGQYLGFLVAGVTTKEMSRVAASIQEIMGVSSYLTLGGRQILAHPSFAGEGRTESHEKLLQQLVDSQDKPSTVIIRDPDSFEGTGDDAFELDEVEAFEFELDGKEYAGFTRSLGDYGDPSLGIGAYCAAKLINAPIQLLYKSATICFLVLAISLGIAAWLSRAIVKPIRRVSAGVTQIGQFDLDEVREMTRSPIREVDDLAISFNRMLAALRAFSTYVPRKLANLVVQGVVGESVASEERELTVMFTDIVGFTALSEGMNAVEVADFINEHLTMLVHCVEETGGTIDKYIGDALMAFWGAPQRLENTAIAACHAATLMSQRLQADNCRRKAEGKQPIRLRIGIHTGPLVVGNIGAPGRINYTVVGDTVNIAQRLESLGKQVDPHAEVITLLSAATATQLADEFVLHPEGEFQLRGKQHDISVHRLHNS